MIYISFFTHQSASLLSNKCLEAPMMDLAFLILALISVSSFRSGVIVDPRYLKLLTKRIFFLSCRDISSGNSFLGTCILASLSKAGKYMHSDLDFIFSFLRCIIRPNLGKWLSSCSIAFWSSWQSWKRKKLSSTK
jgi:hypothetical protein